MRLFVRITRSIRLTEGGLAYYRQCRGALNQMLEAERELMGQQQAPSGTLCICIPTTYGHHRILSLLPEFHRQYPQVRVDIHLSRCPGKLDHHTCTFLHSRLQNLSIAAEGQRS